MTPDAGAVHRQRPDISITAASMSIRQGNLVGTKPPHVVPLVNDPGPRARYFDPGRCRSFLQLAFQRLDFRRERIIDS